MKFADYLKEEEQKLMEKRSESRTNLEFIPPMMGQLGTIAVLDANETVSQLAKLLGVPDGWKAPVKVGNCWASFASGDRLAFFSDKKDYQGDQD